MRYWSCVLVLCFAARLSFAQDKAADPDAINFSARMDTVLVTAEGEGPASGRRLPSLNGDPYDEMLFNYGGSSLHYGGPFLSQPRVANYSNAVSFLADIDGDGIQDMIGPYSIWSAWHRGHRMFPYFDSAATGIFTHGDIDASQTPIDCFDISGDGIANLISFSSSAFIRKLMFWRGGPYLEAGGYQAVQDSLVLPANMILYSQAEISGKHYFFAVTKDAGALKVLAIRLRYPLAASDTFEIVNTAEDGSDGIAVTSIYVTDITGDGIADLLVSDGSYIYIFKGGDDFGSYRLTKSHAYYRIPSPRILYPEQWLDLTGFGSHMYACGDLSGSGTPYLATEGVVPGADRAWRFFYAGGKALDSLYDGVIDIDMAGLDIIDTLWRYGDRAHTAVVARLLDLPSLQHGNLVAVIYRDAELLPHKPNPNLRVGSASVARSSISVVPSIADRSIHITTTYGDRVRRGLLQIHDLLGALVESRNVWVSPESETEFLDLSHFASGTYIATVIPEAGAPISTKFIVQHQGGLNRRLPYTADVPFLPW